MCPIFKNTDILVDDIGEPMHNFELEGTIMTKIRKRLIGRMFREKMLLATSLVKWIIDKFEYQLNLRSDRIYT